MVVWARDDLFQQMDWYVHDCHEIFDAGEHYGDAATLTADLDVDVLPTLEALNLRTMTA